MSHSLTGRFSVVQKKYIHIFSIIKAFLFTFISLQHILVSLSKFLLLGSVGGQQTRYEPGHGGGRRRVSPQTTAASRSATGPVAPSAPAPAPVPLLRRKAPLTPAVSNDPPGDIGRNAKEVNPESKEPSGAPE